MLLQLFLSLLLLYAIIKIIFISVGFANSCVNRQEKENNSKIQRNLKLNSKATKADGVHFRKDTNQSYQGE